MDKQALAQAIRQQRMSYDVETRLPWDRAIHDRILDISESHPCIGLYASFRNEVDTYGIMETLFWDPKKTVCLPKVEQDTMIFYKISGFSDIQSGYKGILEPKEGLEAVTKEAMSMIVIPISVFHENGHRIGYGKGYYDRYLADYAGLKAGLAYSFQKSNEVFYDTYDIACDIIVTEREIYEGKGNPI